MATAASGICRRSKPLEAVKRARFSSGATRAMGGMSQGMAAISRGFTRRAQRRRASGSRAVSAPRCSGGSALGAAAAGGAGGGAPPHPASAAATVIRKLRRVEKPGKRYSSSSASSPPEMAKSRLLFTSSFRSLPTLKKGRRFAGTGTGWPVRGFLPL